MILIKRLTMLNYKEIYTKRHSRTFVYQNVNQGVNSLDIWAKHLPPSGSILELGCGNGILSRYLGHIYDVTGVDVVGDYLYERGGYKYLIHDITEPLPFEDNQFDVGLSFDVFEHIEESDVFNTIAEMVRVSKRQIITIAHDKSLSPELHITVYPAAWWQEMLGDGWVLEAIINRGKKSLIAQADWCSGLFSRNCH